MYNEIVLSSTAVNGAMPSVLDAFFFTQNCWRDPRAHLLALPLVRVVPLDSRSLCDAHRT